jgi:cell volume regulation protein A
MLREFSVQAGAGILTGALLGFAAAFLMGHGRYGILRSFAPVLALVTVIGAYLSADDFGASGFMAVFVAGLILGNRSLLGFTLSSEEDRRLHEYSDTTAVMLRMVIFMFLGTQVDFGIIGQDAWGAAAVSAVLVLVARPLAVLICAWPDRRARWSARELLLLCWVRETGIIPGALAGLLLAQGAPQAEHIAAAVFLAILVTLLLQGSTTGWLARRLGLLEPSD